jgi:hypothetical protein
MPLETMYDELSKELIQINSEIRSNPNWAPIKDGTYNTPDLLKVNGAGLIKRYSDVMKPSGIKAPLDIFIKSKAFNKFADIYKKIVTTLYEAFKNYTSENDKALLLDLIVSIAETGPQENIDIVSPFTAEVVCTLYTPEDKMIANEVLKNLAGNINYDPQKFKVKRKKNTQEYKNAWNKIIAELDSKKFDDDVLTQIRDAINNV